MTSPVPYYLALAVAILAGACGQVLLKNGAVHASAGWSQQILAPYTIGGLLFYVVGALTYIYAIRRVPLTLAFPSNAAAYIVVAVAAHYLWGESFGWPQFAGIVLVGAGIFMLYQG
ncbi:MAG TPA: EamA family transporter [Stellaceae bacterium]|jgi:drug/metabolite transporter (DMT)-like permease|nr:EamA family transporter [Stellaceae bacterium]